MNSLAKSSLLVFAIVIVSFVSYGQETKKEGPKFDNVDFSRKLEIVQWLVEYDNVAWKTTDILLTQDKAEMSKLGAEWFCFQDDRKIWHAAYGKLANDKYELVFHFVMDSASKITRTMEKVDQDFLDSHARALSTARAKLATSIPANSPGFNQFIRRNADKTFNVWLFPAFQTNGLAVYGGEAVYEIDMTGRKIAKDASYFQKNFRGFKSEPPREIWLNYSELEKPSLGAIFFVWYYKSYFTKIFIENADSNSTAVKTGDSYIWVHVEKEANPKIQPK